MPASPFWTTCRAYHDALDRPVGPVAEPFRRVLEDRARKTGDAERANRPAPRR